MSGSAAYESMRKEVVQALFTEWDALEDRTDVWVVAAARDREGLDDAAVARFGTLIDFAPPAAEEHDPRTDDETTTTVVEGSTAPDMIFEDVELPEPVVQRGRLLSAMFAHVDTMESQGITVPRAVLIAGPSRAAKATLIRSLAEQTGLPLIEVLVDDLDGALVTAHDHGRALVAVDVPEYADPGAVAHLAVTIDGLVEENIPIFILALADREDAIDPELRSRFPEFVDLAELEPEARIAKLGELLLGKPLDFDLVSSMEHLVEQTDGMTEEQLRHFVDEAGRKAALRAIDSGTPDQIQIALGDFERRAALSPATKADEAAL